MALYVISDLHLSTQNAAKAMDVFGARWKQYTEKIERNWRHLITQEDTVMIPGDISWGLTLQEAEPDLSFLHSLPGHKILFKGNHDFWWSTVSKLEACFKEKGFDSFSILNNNACKVGDKILAGSRGWFSDPSLQNAANKPDYEKIMRREEIRLRMSLEAAVKLRENQEEILVFFHFPPVWNEFYSESSMALLREFGISRCYFGHIHGVYSIAPKTVIDGIEMNMVAADYLNFIPHRIS